MSEPKRYNIQWDSQVEDSFMEQHPNGEYILATDYDQLRTERDRLREALTMAVDWIEDDRFDDDYIMEDWYHKATAALTQREGGKDDAS